MANTVTDLYKIVCLLVPEMLSRSSFQREPEPEILMEQEENVTAFHAQGQMDGPLVPVYHFNAMAMSRLVPANGSVFDLGSGSGQYLMYLANLRKDITITGIDLSKEMITIGNHAIKTAGLSERVSLCHGDMTCFKHLIPSKVDVISSIFALHHLPGTRDLKICLKELHDLHMKHNCSLWVFDHVRPKLKKTAMQFPKVFTPDSPAKFNQDSTNSLIASFSFAQISRCLDNLFGEKAFHACSRILRLYQAHWIESQAMPHQAGDISSVPLSGKTMTDYEKFRWLFNSVPIHQTRP